MAVLSGVAVGATGTPLVGAPVVATLVDPGTRRAIKGQLGDKTTIRRHQTRTDAVGAWELDLEPNAELAWPTGSGWSIEFDNDKRPIIVEKGAGAETLETVVILDDTALPATPAAVVGEVARQVATLGPADVGADPAGTAGAVAQRIDDEVLPEVDARIPYTEVDIVVDRAGQGRQHLDAARGWLQGLAEAEQGSRPARVVVVADSMGEQSGGMSEVFDTIGAKISGQASWWDNAYWGGFPNLDVAGGTMSARAVGLDRKGATVPAGVTVGRWVVIPDFRYLRSFPATCDVWYTAHPAGGTVTVKVDGDVVGTFDSSLDEHGDPVGAATSYQRWRSPTIAAGEVTYELVVAGGELWLEAVAAPSDVIDRHGCGHSGQSTGHATATAVGHVEAMVARSGPPDLVVLWADTAEQADVAAPQVATLVEQIRAVAPLAAICHVIPHGHQNWGPVDGQPAQAETHRRNDADLGVVTVDLFAAMGPARSDDDQRGWTVDGVHFSELGQRAATQVVLDVLASRRVGGDAAVSARLAAVSEIAARALPRDSALAELSDPTTGSVKGTVDVAMPVIVGVGMVIPGEAYPRVAFIAGDGAAGKAFVGLGGILIGDGTVPPAHPLVMGLATGEMSAAMRRIVALADPVAPDQAATHGSSHGGRWVAVAASRNLGAADFGSTLIVQAAATLTLTGTLIAYEFPLGGASTIVQAGPGAVTVVATGTATLRTPNGATSTQRGQEGTLRRLSNTEWSITWH